MYDQVYEGECTADQALALKVINKELTHLLFVKETTPFLGSDYLTVVLRDDDGTVRLVPRITLEKLARQSNIMGGFSQTAQIAENLDAGADGLLYSMMIPLGHLNVFGGEVLESISSRIILPGMVSIRVKSQRVLTTCYGTMRELI